ncbi:MAG: Gfo/Idh/MocA family oxidoreductase [Bacteroidales bacterium]|nr:Gfo/Idh/MocA family oxidoreductase [Bacteroidales bacterium]
MEKIRWGILGCGNVTEKKSGPAFHTLPNCELQAVMRRDKAKACDYAKRHSAKSYYDNYSDLIADKKVDAIYIATPPSTHSFYAIESLKNGKPVYVEKPMAVSVDECLAMVEASLKYNTPLYVAYYRRRMDYFIKIKEVIDSGVIGKIHQANIKLIKPFKGEFNGIDNWRLNPKISGGGYFVDLASHQLDLLLWYLGEVEDVAGFASNLGSFYQPEDVVNASIKFKSGALANGQWNFIAPDHLEEDLFEIIGEKGRICFSTFKMDKIELYVEDRTEYITSAKPSVVEMPMIDHVTDMILNHKEDKFALKDAVEVTNIINTILKRYYQDIDNAL